jgi:hypothetical protein
MVDSIQIFKRENFSLTTLTLYWQSIACRVFVFIVKKEKVKVSHKTLLSLIFWLYI